jgi:hypothetical protein
MAPVLAPTPTITAAAPPADTAAPARDPLAQALCDHHDRPDVERAARVLRCLDAVAVPHHPAGEAVDLSALQARLGPADALVVYGRHGDELLACVLRAAGVQVVRRLAQGHEVQAACRLVRFQLDAQRHGAGPSPTQAPQRLQHAQALLQALHALVWAPLADGLTDARRVLLLPCAGLAGLPFAALRDGLTCLAQRHLLAEVPHLPQALQGLSLPVAPAGVLSSLRAGAAAAGLQDPGVVGLGLGDDSRRGAGPLAARAQALLAGGSPRVLVCRWPVDAAVSAAFIDRFQHERRLGRGPAEALSEAQAGLMVNHPHPACWAGFVLHGGW